MSQRVNEFISKTEKLIEDKDLVIVFNKGAKEALPTALKLIKKYREALMHSVRHFEPDHVCLFSCRNGIIIKEAIDYWPEDFK